MQVSTISSSTHPELSDSTPLIQIMTVANLHPQEPPRSLYQSFIYIQHLYWQMKPLADYFPGVVEKENRFRSAGGRQIFLLYPNTEKGERYLPVVAL